MKEMEARQEKQMKALLDSISELVASINKSNCEATNDFWAEHCLYFCPCLGLCNPIQHYYTCRSHTSVHSKNANNPKEGYLISMEKPQCQGSR